MIRQVQRKDIDEERWNSIIASSPHESVYPYTWYLDASAENWMALILMDYESIMPVPYKKKYGVRYFYQPYYTQQLGIYSGKEIDPETARMFLLKLGEGFKMGEYAFNAANILGEEPGFEVQDRTNYTLNLNREYEELYLNFSENCRRNIRKACQSAFEFTDRISVEELVSLKRESEEIQRSDAHYQHISNMFSKLTVMGKIKIFGVRINNQLCSAALFGFSNNRVIYLLSASNAIGKEHRGMFHVIDTFIQMHAGENLILDFEGSDISSIARFFAGFGAKPEIYQRISYNRLPGFIQKIKKNV